MITERRRQRIAEMLARRQPDLTVLMERVRKPHNFAAILRTCDAVGIHEAHAVTGGEALPDLGGTTRGAHKWVSVVRHADTPAAIAHLKAQGFLCYAAHLSATAVDFRSIDYTQPAALIAGTECHGVSPEALALADRQITIPMLGMTASLNVSVACAVVLYEAQRQRQAAGFYDRPRLDPDSIARLLEALCTTRA